MEGFEPPIRLPVYLISNQAPSAGLGHISFRRPTNPRQHGDVNTLVRALTWDGLRAVYAFRGVGDGGGFMGTGRGLFALALSAGVVLPGQAAAAEGAALAPDDSALLRILADLASS